MEKRESSYTVGGTVNWYNHYGEQCGGSLKNLKIELLYDPATPLLGIYPEKTRIQKDTCTPVFIVTLFIVAKSWEQPKCPLTEEWIKKMRHAHAWNITQPKKEWNNAVCSNMDGPRDYHTMWSVRQRKIYIIWYHLYVESD